MRYYGCQLPWNPLQVLAWVLVPVFLTHYYLWYMMAVPLAAQIVLSIAFGATAVVSCVTGWYIMFVDPADPNVLRKRLELTDAASRPTSAPLGKGQRPIENNYCRLCEVQVAAKSKHCRVCDKCVDVFDHHCKWLNTCIGRRNYRVFMVYVSTTFGTAVFHCLTGVGLLIECAREYAADNTNVPVVDAFRSNVPSLPVDFRAFIAVTAVFIVLACIAIFLLGQLFFFHISLIRRGITTYEHIIRERQRKDDEEKQKQESVKLEMAFVPGKAVPDSAASTSSHASSTPRVGWSDDSSSRQSGDDVELRRVQGTAGGPMPETPKLPLSPKPPHASLPPLHAVASLTESVSDVRLTDSTSNVLASSTRSLPHIRGIGHGGGTARSFASDADAVHAVSESDMMSPHGFMTPHSGMTTPHSSATTPRVQRLQPSDSEPETPNATGASAAGNKQEPINLDLVVRSEPSTGGEAPRPQAAPASPLLPAVPMRLSRPQY